MNRYILFIALTAGLLLATFPKEVCGIDPVNEQNSGVSLTITKFHVNDQTLELGWKIINNTDHDVWICDSVNTDGVRDFEVFIAEDAQTLVIRRRFDLSRTQGIFERPFVGRYVRLSPGQDRAESISFSLPPDRQNFFEAETSYTPYAKRLSLEIGFFDEDLRELLVNIIKVADKLNCDTDIFLSSAEEERTYYRFFEGFTIASIFKSSDPSPRGGPVDDPVHDGGEEILIPHMRWVRMGEKVLRATINDVSIPCHLDPQSEKEPAEVTMALTGFDVNDTHLELSWNIINNTDHDVWVCNGYERSNGSIRYFERFIDKDNKTLVLRRRYNLSSEGIIVERNAIPRNFRYLRLSPGQEKVESHSFTLSVTPITLFHAPGEGRLNVESAQRLAIEIGFYDEDLRALILGVVDMVEKLGCDGSAVSNLVSSDASAMRLYYRFFGGFKIARLFTSENISFFRNSVTSDGDEILKPPMDIALNGEQVLRIEVDNLPIPFSIF